MKIITQKELNLILENHKLWLKGNIKGEKADLSNTNLRNVNLAGVDLSYANLKGADLSFADLTGANLMYANLYMADLTEANLTSVNLSNAKLFRVKLFDTELYKTDLSNTDLTNLASFNFLLNNTASDRTYYQVMGIGNTSGRGGITTYCVEDKHIFCSCWSAYRGGSLEEFEERIEKIYGEKSNNPNEFYHNQYKNAIKYFKLCINRRKQK